MSKIIIRKKVLLIFFFALVFLANNIFQANGFHKGNYQLTIWSDAEGYYQYLPSLFIKNDITHQPYAFSLENGNTVNKYTCGVAIMQMPFFFAAHIYSHFTGKPTSGYTPVYGISLLIAASFYSLLGLYLLFKILLRFFSKNSSLITVFSVYLATNLFYYTAGESGMAHVYSFFLICWFLYILPSFLQKPSIKNTLITGFAFAIAVLIRPTNIIIGVFFLLYGVTSFSTLKERILFLIHNYAYLILIGLVFFLAFIPQMLYWKAVTGNYFVYSYQYSYTENESFIYWKSPRIIPVLFGVRSGWLIYTPIMVFSLIGIIFSFAKKKIYIWPVFIVLLLAAYINSSWWAYTFSCGFGYRSLVDFYPVMAIPLALFINLILNFRKKLLTILMISGFVILSFMNIRMSQLYSQEPCWDSLTWTWKNYNKVLLKVFYLKPKDYSVK